MAETGFKKGDLVRETFKPGDVIFLEGESTSGLYLLEKGEIDVIKGDEVVASISEPHTFFGEMSYLVNQKRTASLKAKTEVTAIRISSTDSFSALIHKIPDKVILLMRTLASRLDLLNTEMEEDKKYKHFYETCHEKAQKENRNDILEWFNGIEEDLQMETKERNFNLIKQYLLTPRVWSVIKDALCDVIHHYTQEDLSIDRVDAFDKDALEFDDASYITYHGDIGGGMVIHLEKNYAEFLNGQLGLPPEDLQDEELSKEMANQILGTIQTKITVLDINISTPVSKNSKEEILEALGDHPVLRIDFSSKHGKLVLLFQIESVKRKI